MGEKITGYNIETTTEKVCKMNTNLQWINERIKQGLPTAVATEKEEVNIDFGLSYS